MADSKRQQIVTAVDLKLKTILGGPTYETELGKSVHEWADVPLEELQCPGAIWRDTSEPEDLTFGEHVHTLRLEVELFAVGSNAPKQLRKMMADVVKAFGADRGWSGLAQDTLHRADDMATERESRRLGSATVRFDILYTTAHFDPYN